MENMKHTMELIKELVSIPSPTGNTYEVIAGDNLVCIARRTRNRHQFFNQFHRMFHIFHRSFLLSILFFLKYTLLIHNPSNLFLLFFHRMKGA